eukprot:914462-Amphidinium_carterae.1
MSQRKRLVATISFNRHHCLRISRTPIIYFHRRVFSPVLSDRPCKYGDGTTGLLTSHGRGGGVARLILNKSQLLAGSVRRHLLSPKFLQTV